ncbi:MAG: hypothetical protein WAW61_06765 [Methylococcaceae bacterium]
MVLNNELWGALIMTISYFVRVYQALLSLFCRHFPAFFAQKVCGRLVYVSKFPTMFLGYSESPGWYFVDSFVFLHTGDLEIGLEIELGSVEYFSVSELEISDIVINSSKIVPLLKSAANAYRIRCS